MARVGTFGTNHKAAGPPPRINAGDDIEYRGLPIRLRSWDQVPPLAMMEFARVVDVSSAARSMEAQSILYGVLESCVHPEDWLQFRALALTNADPAQSQELIDMAFALYERWSGRPFAQRQDSSDGPSIDKTEEPSVASSPPKSRRSKRPASSIQEPASRTQPSGQPLEETV